MSRREKFLLFLGLVAFVVVTLASGKRLDYVSYSEQWTSAWAGDVPWRAPEAGVDPTWNTYGPLFLVFVPVYALWSFLPKILFALTWAAGYLRLRQLLPEGSGPAGATWLRWTYVLAPFFWVEVAYYGYFDIVVAWLVVLAALAIRREKTVAGAMALAAGVLLKFSPLALLPALAYRQRRLRFAFGFLTLGLVGLGLAVPYLVWGEAAFYALRSSAARGPKLLSIFAFLQGEASPWGQFPPDFSALSLPLMAFFAAAAAVFGWLFGLSELLAATLAALGFVAFYKVGHPQFYTTPMLLLLAWLADLGFAPVRDHRWLRWPVATFLGWLSVVVLTYTWTGGFRTSPWPAVREVLGLPTFLIDLWLLAALGRYGLQTGGLTRTRAVSSGPVLGPVVFPVTHRVDSD